MRAGKRQEIRQKTLWHEFENNLLNQGVTQKRIDKLQLMFKVVERGIKDFSKAGRPEIEKFITALNRDDFKATENKPYSGSSKSDIKKFIKQFWKWHKGDNEFFPKEVSWIKSNIRKDERPEEKETISIDEARKLAASFLKVKYKIAILILFDSGFRIEELLSVIKKNITWEDYDESQKCFWIKCNKSKTEIRNIPIPLFTDDLKLFFNSSEYQQLKENDLIFDFSYHVFLGWLKKKGAQVLNKKITPHCLRHSSATYYARELGDTVLLANRYGWSYSSNELDTYIRRSGTQQKQAAKRVFTNELIKTNERVAQLEKELTELRAALKNMSLIKQLLGMKPQELKDEIERRKRAK